MKKSFFKNLARDIKKTISRFLSIVIIIAVGVAFYAGVRATSPDMKMSGDLYFNKNNLMDFKIISTLGLTKNDIAKISKIKGVTRAEGSYSLDAVIEKDGRSQVLNINSLPKAGEINEIRIISGRMPENINEAVVEDRFLKNNKLGLGDRIDLKSGTEGKIEDNLKNNEFKIVGTAESPLYISAQRQLSSVGNGSVRGFVYILPEVFKSDVYTEAYVRTEGNESENSLVNNDEYIEAMKPIEESLKSIGDKRGEIRYSEVIKEGTDKLNKAEKDLVKGRQEAKDKFADAHKKLDGAREKILKGKEKLQKNEDLFNKGMAEGKKKIDDSKKQILSAENTMNSKFKDIEKGRLEIAAGKKKIDDSEKRLNAGKQQAAEGIAKGFAENIKSTSSQLLLNPLNPVLIAQLSSLNNMNDKYIKGKNFDSMYSALKKDNMLGAVKPYFDMESLKLQEAKLTSGRNELLANEKKLNIGEAKLNLGKAEIQAKKKELARGEAKLNASKLSGLRKLADGKMEIEKGETELNKNAQKLRDEEVKANKKLQEGADEIRKNREKLNDIKKPEWYVLGRGTNVGYETYRQDSDRINNIGKVFPLIFFLVAALVSLTTMTRMVQDKRVEIGTFKALGYSSKSIVAHYLIYALSASIIGSIIGISIGFRLFPPLIMNAYGSLYAIPYKTVPFNTRIALLSSFVAVLFVAAAAAVATMGELREVPASLMRPKPPKSGKKIFLERVTFIWKRLSFTRKVTARNIFRYKQRLLMTVVGIAACTALMITGFGLKEGVIGATKSQFSDIYKYNMQGSLTKNISENEKNDMKAKIMENSNVKSVLFTVSKNAEAKIDGSKEQDVYIIVPENKDDINNYINLTMNNKNLKLNDQGVIITEKLSRIVNKKVGDVIKITINDKEVEAKVSGITRHYIQHYIYMSPTYYEQITGKKITYNSFYGLLNNTTESYQENTTNKLKKIKDINSIGFKNNVQIDYNKSIDSINSVVWILIISAGVLAFVVIYNLTNINITERRRELATIKLLGFYNNELASYIYRENMILTVIGSITGIFLGIILNRYILTTAETNVIMFLNKISPIYFIYSVLLTIFFSLVVNLAMYSRFDKIDMIESLKSVE